MNNWDGSGFGGYYSAGGFHQKVKDEYDEFAVPDVPAVPPKVEMITSENGESVPIDISSRKGQFGWCVVGGVYLPFLRRGHHYYLSVRMAESHLLGKLLARVAPSVYAACHINSYMVTQSEARLLNEINIKHSDCRYGREHFTLRDLIVKIQDATNFYNYLNNCIARLSNILPEEKYFRCGFIKINGQSIVPYTIKNSEKYLPLFYFEGEIDTLKSKCVQIDSWDLTYLKFCCSIQGIRSELYAGETCEVISFEVIKSYFPRHTTFEEYWPSKFFEPRLISRQARRAAGGLGFLPATNGGAWFKDPGSGSLPSYMGYAAPNTFDRNILGHRNPGPSTSR